MGPRTDGARCMTCRLRKLQNAAGSVNLMSIVDDTVLMIDSVKGDGSSVIALAAKINAKVSQLPMMIEKIPKKWVTLRQIIKADKTENPLRGKQVLQKHEVAPLLKSCKLDLTDEKLWEVLEFWGMLGDVMVNGDVLVLDIQQFIELMRPLLHHAPSESLKILLLAESGCKAIDFDEIVVPNFAQLKKDERGQIEEWIEDLENKRVLCFEALKYFSCWRDLNEAQQRSAIYVLESCHLLVDLFLTNRPSLSGAGGRSSSWLVTSRLSKAPQSALRDPAEVLNSRCSLMLRVSADLIPSGYFLRLLACQMVARDQLTAEKVYVDSLNLHMRYKSLFGSQKNWEELTLRQINSAEEVTIEVWSTSLAIFKHVTCEIDRLKLESFPAIVFKSTILFRNSKFSTEILSWNLKRKDGSIGAILEQRLFERQISANVWNQKQMIDNVTVRDVVDSILMQAEFFLSHAWCDLSVHENARVKVIEGLQRIFEEKSGALMWIDKNEMHSATQFHQEMERGISGCVCPIICLSRLYLTRKNCLLELSWAVKAHISDGKPLIVVSVDPELTFETIQRWSDGSDLVATVLNNKGMKVEAIVDRRTVAFVKKFLLGVQIFTEWKDGEGIRSEQRESAVTRILKSLQNQTQKLLRPSPKIHVHEESSRFYICEVLNFGNLLRFMSVGILMKIVH